MIPGGRLLLHSYEQRVRILNFSTIPPSIAIFFLFFFLKPRGCESGSF